jgi:hypothetical protein
VTSVHGAEADLDNCLLDSNANALWQFQRENNPDASDEEISTWASGQLKALCPRRSDDAITDALDKVKKKSGAQKTHLDQFILNPEHVQRKVPFPVFRSAESLAVGLFLPRWQDIRVKGDRGKGDIVVGREQRDVPVIITSDHEIFEPRYGQIEPLKVRVESIPGELDLRWSLPSIGAFLTKKAPTVQMRDVFNKLKAAYEEVLYFGMPAWYTTHAIWDIGTYFHQLFYAYPYLELRGVKASAKSKVMLLSSCVTFNSTGLLASPTESTLFRTTHDKRPTTYLDEAENLFRVVKGNVEHDGRVEVLNTGYSKGGAVPRMESIGKRWVQVVYHCYSPKMISSINGLYGATESRAIVHVTVRAPDTDARGEKEVEPNDPRWKELRDDLYLLLMQQWTAVEDAYSNLQHNNPTMLKKREWQLWRPLLAIARVIGKEVFDELVEHAEKLAKVRTEDVQEGSFDYILLSRVKELLGQSPVVLLKDIAAAAEWAERKPHSKTLRRKMDGFGFADDYVRTKEGTAYRIEQEKFSSIVATLAPGIFPSLPSFASPSDNFVVDKVEIDEMKDGEANTKTVKEAGEGNEGNVANEGNLDSTPQIKALQDAPIAIRTLGEAGVEELVAMRGGENRLPLIEKELVLYAQHKEEVVENSSQTSQPTIKPTTMDYFLMWVNMGDGGSRSLVDAREKYPGVLETALRDGSVCENPSGCVRVVR